MRKTFNINGRSRTDANQTSSGGRVKGNRSKSIQNRRRPNIESKQSFRSNLNDKIITNNKIVNSSIAITDNIIYGIHPVTEALNINPKMVEKVYIKIGLSNKDLPALLAICKENKIPVTEISGEDKMRDLAGTSYHQGLIAITRDFEYIEIEDVLKMITENRKANKASLIIIMDELTDTQNVGAIIRTAVGVGATAVIVPKHRQAPITGATYKASAGMVNHIPIARVANLGVVINKLKDAHVWVAALAMDTPSPLERETGGEANSLWSLDMVGDMAIVVGNEGEGVHKHNIENSDYIISIPMDSKLESLNASVSAAIAMYEWKRQNFSTVQFAFNLEV